MAFRRSGNLLTPEGKLSSTPADPDIATRGFEAYNPMSDVTAVEHATGQARTEVSDVTTHERVMVSNSRHVSMSRNPNISQFHGELYAIDMDKLPPDTEVVENSELLKQASEKFPPDNPFFESQTKGISGRPAEMEVLASPRVPPEAITPVADLPKTTVALPPAVMPAGGMAGWIGRNGSTVGKVGTVVGVAVTVHDLGAAGQRSLAKNDWRPLAGEGIRQAFQWGGSILGGIFGQGAGLAIGAGFGATAGAPTGPGEALTIPSGAVIGGFAGGILGSIAGALQGRLWGNGVVSRLGWN